MEYSFLDLADEKKLVILEDYKFVLSYIVEPNKKVYYCYQGNDLVCSSNIDKAMRFESRNLAVRCQYLIKECYGLEFQIERCE